MSREFTEWDEFEKSLNLTEEEKEEIRKEEEKIEAVIAARRAKNRQE